MDTNNRRAGSNLGIKIGGTAAVFCLHDRQKAQITEEAQVLALAPPGAKIDGDHQIRECPCCRNLFVTDSPIDEKCLPCDPARQRLLAGTVTEGGITLPRGAHA